MSKSMRLFAALALSAIALACWSGVASPAQDKKAVPAAPPVPKWEYKVIRAEPGKDGREVAADKMEAALNKLGEEGWECVGTVGEVTGSAQQGTWTRATLICKRPKQ